MEYIIKETDEGKKLLSILKENLCLSTAFIKHLKFIPDGIKINNSHVTVRYIVKNGDILSLATEDTEFCPSLTPTDIPLLIAFEDESIIIPIKPAFMPTHPSHLHHGDTLADAVSYKYKKSNQPFIFRPISRLDRNTSGLTLIAKDRICASKLSEQMRNGEIKKLYIAILCNTPENCKGTIDTYIRRTAQSIIIRENCLAGEGGDRAITNYYVLCQNKGYSLVLAAPLTGRTHQLRVHFSSIGCPILGDDIYGKESKIINRHALHAINLRFTHPKNNEAMNIFAPFFDDMRLAVSSLFGEEWTETAKLKSEILKITDMKDKL